MKSSKHIDAFSRKHLGGTESVVAWVEGYIGEMMGKGDQTQHNGALLVTQERVIFYRKGWLGEIIKEIPIWNVTAIERSSILDRCKIVLHSQRYVLEFKTFHRDRVALVTKAIEARRKAPINAIPLGLPPSELLRRLEKVNDDGSLAPSEYETSKSYLQALDKQASE